VHPTLSLGDRMGFFFGDQSVWVRIFAPYRGISMKLACLLPLLTISMLIAVVAAQEPSPAVRDAVAKAQKNNHEKHYQDAIKVLRGLPKDEMKNCYDCAIEMAFAQSLLGDVKDAIESSNRAIVLATTTQQKAEAHRIKGSALTNGAAQNPKFLPAAEAEFRQALEIDPKSDLAELMLGTALLKESRDPEGIAELKRCLEIAPANSPLRPIAQSMIDQPRRARFRFAPEFEVTTAQGEHLSLKQLAGHVVVLDFWATWCAPCRASVPEIKELSRKYSDKKLVIISISNDQNKEQWQDFIAKKQMTWPQFYDQDRKVSKLFNVNAFPTYMIIDGDGAIVKELIDFDPQHSLVARLRDTLHEMKELE
jgi:thiol-disulfide isomerase/thioredoxin